MRVFGKPFFHRSSKGDFQFSSDIDFAHTQFDGAANILIRHIACAMEYQRNIHHFTDFRQTLEVDFGFFGVKAMSRTNRYGQAIYAR